MVTPLVGEINDAGGTAHFVELDVVNQGQCDAAVAAIREQEWQQVAARKERIAAQCELNATLAAERMTDKLQGTADIPLNTLVPAFGVSVDKLAILRGNVPSVNIANIVMPSEAGRTCQSMTNTARSITDDPSVLVLDINGTRIVQLERHRQASPGCFDMGARAAPRRRCKTRAAYWRRKPTAGLLMHSDRGSQYASHSHRQLIKDYRMVQSMSRRASCWDNAAMESFFKTLKVERIHLCRYDTRALAKLDIVDWIEGFYNHKRMHSSIGYKTPVNVESGFMVA
jgi:hypothetical protein